MNEPRDNMGGSESRKHAAAKPGVPAGWQARLAGGDKALRVHLVGIGGSGLSAIAQVLLDLGMTVSGSDRQPNSATERLTQAGATVFATQAAENLIRSKTLADVVLISSAVDRQNPERRAADELGLPVVKRAEFLSHLLAEREVIAVAGTHGKSTTTAMIVHILRTAGIDAGYIVGSWHPTFGNAAAGSRPYFVIEADEYDHMFLGLRPTVAVITNVEWDHPDCYPTPASFRRAFMQFVDRVHRVGQIISCTDDLGAEQLRKYAFTRGPNWITYGIGSGADLWAVKMEGVDGAGCRADLIWRGEVATGLALQVPGVHNLANAMAALAAARWCGVSIGQGAASLSQFRGAARRFEWKGEAQGVTIIDDYAHHPTEIRATLQAARQRFPTRRIWAVLQPHTYSRTRLMLRAMAESLRDADAAIVTDIYAAREQDDGQVSAADLAGKGTGSIQYIAGLEDAAGFLTRSVRPGDVVITLGAGDGYRVGELLLAALQLVEEKGRA